MSALPASASGWAAPRRGGSSGCRMAKLPQSLEAMIDEYGPHAASQPAGGWGAAAEPDKLVKTHCCFCGVQCGIQLKVKQNQVVGFEPWEEFPVNKGMLCPKGVKRYLQSGHPDR